MSAIPTPGLGEAMNHLSVFATALERLGGISTLEDPSTRRALEQLDHEADEAAARAAQLREDYATAMQGDLSTPATFAGHCSWLKDKQVWHVLQDSLDSKDFMERAMRILADAAAGKGTQREAQELLREAGQHWAELWVD